jgi:diguanylate cyclase (GGDEF)-like protein
MKLKAKLRLLIALYVLIPLLVIGGLTAGSPVFRDPDFQNALTLGLAAAVLAALFDPFFGGHWLATRQLARLKRFCSRIRNGDYDRIELPKETPHPEDENEIVSLMRDMNWMANRIRVRERELTAAIAHLERLSYQDGLTGIPNRRYFDKILAQEWLRSQREGAPLSLIMIDIDCFKSYNDAWGHLRGDDCLRRVAQALDAVLQRPGDMAFRYGGEEFAVILPATDEAGAMGVAEKMRKAALMLKIAHGGSTVGETVTVSLGVATRRPCAAEMREAFVGRADAALYAAKQGGRNRVAAAPYSLEAKQAAIP